MYFSDVREITEVNECRHKINFISSILLVESIVFSPYRFRSKMNRKSFRFFFNFFSLSLSLNLWFFRLFIFVLPLSIIIIIFPVVYSVASQLSDTFHQSVIVGIRDAESFTISFAFRNNKWEKRTKINSK